MHDELVAVIQQQLHEQIEALENIDQVLAAGGHDEELLAVKEQLEEAIPALRDSLAELQQQHHSGARANDSEDNVQAVSDAAWQPLPDWMQPGAICRFRYQNGQWYHGVVDSVQQEQPMPVLVHFRFPTRPFMLHPVQLPAGLVLPGSSSSSSSKVQQQQQQQQQQLSVGSRVLALPPGQQLWQPAEITTISAAAAAATSSGECCCTVMLTDTGQACILPSTAVAVSATADIAQAELDNIAAAAAAATSHSAAAAATSHSAAAAATGHSAAAATRHSAAAGESAGALHSEMSSSESESESSAGSSSGFESDRDGSEQDAAEGHQQQQQEDGDHVGLGSGGVMAHARLAAAAGAQTETATFADWEHHGRGIASRLMARMGFKRGGGLGKKGAGISTPLEITLLPSKKGLGAVDKNKHQKAHGTGSKKRKQSRGGERKRRRKAAEARHAAKAASHDRQQRMEAATGSEGLFAFINHSLGDGSEAAGRVRDAVGTCGGRKQQQQQQQQTGGAAALASAAVAAGGGQGPRRRQQQQQQPDRKGLIGSHDNLAEKKAHVAQLTAMLERNRTNKGLAPQIQAKLQVAQRQLDAAAAEHRQLHKAVARKEATDKWIKF